MFIERRIFLKKILKAGSFIILYLAIYYIMTNYVQMVLILGSFIRDILSDPGFLDAFSGTDTKAYTQSFVKYIPYVQIATATVSFFIYWFITRLRKENIFEVCAFKNTRTSNLIISSILGISLVLPVTLLMSIFSFNEFSKDNQDMINSIVTDNSIIVILLSLGIIAPFIEELIFRGLILHELKKIMPIPAAILLQAFLFGIYHGNLYQAIYAVVLGIILGYLCYKTGSIFAPILLHIFYNSSSLIMQKVLTEYMTEQQLAFFTVAILYLSVVFIIFAFIVLPQINKKESSGIFNDENKI